MFNLIQIYQNRKSNLKQILHIISHLYTTQTKDEEKSIHLGAGQIINKKEDKAVEVIKDTFNKYNISRLKRIDLIKINKSKRAFINYIYSFRKFETNFVANTFRSAKVNFNFELSGKIAL